MKLHQATLTVHWEMAWIDIHPFWKTRACTMAPFSYYWEYCSQQPHCSPWILQAMCRTSRVFLNTMTHLFHALINEIQMLWITSAAVTLHSHTHSSAWTAKIPGSVSCCSCFSVCAYKTEGCFWRNNPLQSLSPLKIHALNSLRMVFTILPINTNNYFTA